MTTLKDLTPGVWTVDPSHSTVGFVARHLVAKVRGKFTEFTADVKVGDELEDSTLTATVQLGSIETGSADRDGHLKSGDFFDIENTPEMTFTSTKITPDTLEGDLTIKGVTKPVTFDLEFEGVSADPWGGTRAGFDASTEISRKDFGLTWNVAVEGGNLLVGDKVKINLEIELVKA